jgi:threonine/homoserine/homoserine lactone efflux protein
MMPAMGIAELSAASLLGFAATTTLMNITPGPAVMQVVGHAMSNGWRAAQASILGIFAANAMYCALSVLGLGALILAAPSLFEVFKWCGVCYLAWLGLSALRATARAGTPRQVPTLRARPLALFRQSFVLQGANPKSVLYFCTLLPVFAGNAEGAPLRIAVLGLVATVMEYPVLLGYSLLAASARRWFRGTTGRRVLDGLSGSALLAAAGTVAGNTLPHR